MAPALIEAAASVSQNPKRKFDFIKTEILEGLTGDFAKERGFATTAEGRTLETKPSSGQLTTQLSDTVRKSQIINREKFFKLHYQSIEKMEAISGERRSSDTDISYTSERDKIGQSSQPKTKCSSETCARSEVEGGKTEGIRSQPFAESTPYISLRERTIKSGTKFQSLDRRARYLKQRVRSFQTNHLLSHVKTQAQLLDYSNKTIHERTINGPKPDDSVFAGGKNKGQVLMKSNNDRSQTPLSRSSPNITSLLRSAPNVAVKMGQDSIIDSNSGISDNKNELDKTDTVKKEEVFGILTNSVKEIMNLDDPEVTDPESDEDDTTYAGHVKDKRENNMIRKKKFDTIWAKDRVKIGSMCTWIQAQIADLSHKIKRYGDLHHHVKANRKQLSFEETRKSVATGHTVQRQLEDSFLVKDDLNGDSLQSNIFARLQAHKNGLAKELIAENETKYEKGCGARTVPAAKFPQHKYVKRSIETAFKGNSVSYQCTNLPAPFPCAQCIKASATGFSKTSPNLAAVILDHSYHEQLSTKYDLPLPVILESTLRKDKISFEKKSLLPAASVKSTLAEKKDSGSKAVHDNLISSRTSKNVKRLEKKRHRRPSKPADDESEKEESPVPKKKPVPQTAASLLQRRANSLRAPSSGSGESRPSTPSIEQNMLSASCPAPAFSQLVKRKTRTSSEYDINNIVIPYSISSSTRLEKPQYKEILTPGWRPIDGELDGLNSTSEQWEDTRDSAYAQRHSRSEITEHHKFTAYFQLPFKRSRPSRKSSECNTPEPYSPSHPDTPSSTHTPTDFVLATPSSGSKLNKQSSWTLMSNLDDSRVLPWSCRTFPLEGEDLVNLDNENPEILAGSIQRTEDTEEKQEIMTVEDEITEPCQTMSDHSSDNEQISPPPEALEPGEDDEKWTVKLVTDVKPSPADSGTLRKGIVLKLAKK